MKYLEIFLLFFKIGIFTFGGGHAMIPMISEEMQKNAWLTEAELKQLIAISESTPGPFAINIATFIGSTQYGFLGSLCATLGVLLPSIIIILFIASLFQTFAKSRRIRSLVRGVNPVIIGLILSAGLWILYGNIFTYNSDSNILTFDYVQIILFVVLFTIYQLFNKKIHPIVLIISAGILGIVIYQFYTPPTFNISWPIA